LEARGFSGILAAGAVALALIPSAAAATLKIVDPFPLDRFAREGAVGLLVPGHGATVTRANALEALKLPKDRSDETYYVSLPPPGRSHNVKRYPVAVVGSAFRGLLTSSSTRIPGLIAIDDFRKHVAAGEESSPLAYRADADAPRVLRRLDRRLTEAHDARDWATLVLVAALVPLGLGLMWGSSRFARVGLLVIPAALASALVISAFGGASPGTAVPALALLTLGGALAGAWLPLRAILLVFLAGYLVTLAKSPAVNSLAIIGPHPDGGGRFYGITNEVETLLLAPLLAAATVSPILAGILGVITVGWSKAGADGGGILVFLVALLVLAVRRAGLELTARRVAVVGGVAILLGLVVVGLDAALGGSSHVTGAIRSGPDSLAGDLAHRFRVSWDGATRSLGAVAKVLVGAIGLVALATRRPRPATVDALLVAVVVSLVVNDTPTDVLAFGALAGAALWVWEQTRRLNSPPVPRRSLLALPLLGIFLLAGCGGGRTASPTPQTVVGTVPTGPTVTAKKGDAASGKGIFASAGCGSCHTLKAAGSTGTIGPNLDDLKPSLELAVTRVTNGKAPMPAFKGQLTEKQISDVATFVVESTGGS
jgi:cytochrome c553